MVDAMRREMNGIKTLDVKNTKNKYILIKKRGRKFFKKIQLEICLLKGLLY